MFWMNHHVSPFPHLQRSIGNQAPQQNVETNSEVLKAGMLGTASPRFGHDFSRIPIHLHAAGAIQTKLTVNKPGDEYEQEADHVSQQVMGMSEVRSGACACGGECPRCQTQPPRQGYERLHTKRAQASAAEETSTSPGVREVLRSPGQPLDPATRAFMESRFRHEFSHVRVHTDERAADSARALNARAYTVGHDVAFASGQYAPQTSEGRRLLAHELTHTVQQSTSFIRLQRTPDAKDDLQKVYGITIEKGDKDWKEDEVRVLQATLGRLGPNKGIVKGYKFVRWSNTGARIKNDPTYIKPAGTSNENCLQEYAPAQGIFRIAAYDACFSSAEARPGTDVTHGIDTGQFRLLHEIGHAAEHAEHRQALLAKEAADRALKDAQSKYKKPEEQKAHQTELTQLADAVRAANDAIQDTNGRAFNEFKKLMKGKKIMDTVNTSTDDPAKYTDADYAEAFAEMFAAYTVDPSFVKKEYPAVYEWMQKNKYLKK